MEIQFYQGTVGPFCGFTTHQKFKFSQLQIWSVAFSSYQFQFCSYPSIRGNTGKELNLPIHGMENLVTCFPAYGLEITK